MRRMIRAVKKFRLRLNIHAIYLENLVSFYHSCVVRGDLEDLLGGKVFDKGTIL